MNSPITISSSSEKRHAMSPQKPYRRGLVVFQRDLRFEDQRALSEALMRCEEVVLLALFDPICHKLPLESNDVPFHRFNLRARLSALKALEDEARERELELTICVGDSLVILTTLCKAMGFQAVFLNEIYEPRFTSLYNELTEMCSKLPIDIIHLNDHEPVPEALLISGSGGPYKVFTPFYRKWRSLLSPQTLAPWFVDSDLLQLKTSSFNKMETDILEPFREHWKSLTFERLCISQTKAKQKLQNFLDDGMLNYSSHRDYPSLKGTSALSIDLNNGLISYRSVVSAAYHMPGGESFLRQLAWKHFYMLILNHYPEIENTAFLQCFRQLPWANDPKLLEAWKSGHTGIPLVDAAMKELAIQGTMHNRLRMVCASILVKQLDTDWRIGEAYFYEYLADGDLALNNGGWQWCASTGTDAQPYFRIFNPLKQQETYDGQSAYRSKWLEPEFLHGSPIVDLKISAAQAKLKYQMAKRGVLEDEDNTY